MNNNMEERLHGLFEKAKIVRPDTEKLADNFEKRLLNRVRAKREKEATLSFWSWRLAPVMTIILFLFIILNAFIPARPPDILSIIISGHEQNQVKKYLTGE
ncbi:MAG TPA: hypothetical protein ENN23_09055 [Deltaproteobacteria bacterium]|nr:hypothetical protein [Deltaproteobacteria bacterium]